MKKRNINPQGFFYPKWEILDNQTGFTSNKEIVKALLINRGLKTTKGQKDFFNPVHPNNISCKDLGINESSLSTSIKRLKKALKYKEKIIVYGDYDADGVCATAILWETLYAIGFNVTPYIPERFSEGYGINFESIKTLKEKDGALSIVITVDNGIVANKEIDAIRKLGIDVIVTDHHQRGSDLPSAFSVVYTDKVCGSGISWFFSREIISSIKSNSGKKLIPEDLLDLAAIGTIADQMNLTFLNRSFAKHGIEVLKRTKRQGLLALLNTAGVDKSKIGTYEVNFVIAPRINAMGRLEHAIDSLRLLCVKNKPKAEVLAAKINTINTRRQKIVDEVVLHAREEVRSVKATKTIIIAHESYHEGVIGLAAGKLAEEFYKPAIVFYKGEKISKASARSIPGFNIIEAIRKLDGLLEGGGGHPMAAGFSITTDRIELFTKKFNELAEPYLTEDVLSKKIKVDFEVEPAYLTKELYQEIKLFEPFGLGNPTPIFAVKDAQILDARLLGAENKHLKLKISKKGYVFDAIGFNMGVFYNKLSPERRVGLVFNLEENTWNGNTNLQLRIKDISSS